MARPKPPAPKKQIQLRVEAGTHAWLSVLAKAKGETVAVYLARNLDAQAPKQAEK